MWLRRAYFRLLFPAVIVLPLWLLLGWGVFQAGGWAFLWVLFIAIPSVFVGQLAFSLLARARPSVQSARALSWLDVGGFALWHLLTILVGLYSQRWFPLLLSAAMIAGAFLLWLLLRQLRAELREIQVTGMSFTADGNAGFSGPDPSTSRTVPPSQRLIVTDVDPRERTGDEEQRREQ